MIADLLQIELQRARWRRALKSPLLPTGTTGMTSPPAALPRDCETSPSNSYSLTSDREAVPVTIDNGLATRFTSRNGIALDHVRVALPQIERRTAHALVVTDAHDSGWTAYYAIHRSGTLDSRTGLSCGLGADWPRREPSPHDLADSDGRTRLGPPKPRRRDLPRGLSVRPLPVDGRGPKHRRRPCSAVSARPGPNRATGATMPAAASIVTCSGISNSTRCLLRAAHARSHTRSATDSTKHGDLRTSSVPGRAWPVHRPARPATRQLIARSVAILPSANMRSGGAGDER